MSRIKKLFVDRKADQKIMSLFITAGYPDANNTVRLIHELEDSGADLIEIGMPFSDPLADGPTIQYASKIAIDNGIHLEKIFKMVKEIRSRSEIPIVLMGYLNPVLQFGLESFFRKASISGVDGVIIPDAPPGEFTEIDRLCETFSIDPIYLIAPNTSDKRMQQIDQSSRGFVYCVSVTGVTGARDGSEINESVQKFISRVNKNVTRNPVMIGFGIRSHEDAINISRNADGFIIGSALIDFIRGVYPSADWISQTGNFVRQLKTGDTLEEINETKS